MRSNKDRLYVTLHARGGSPTMPGLEDTYHWCLLVGPKIETGDAIGVRYDARERITQSGHSEYFFAEAEVHLKAIQMLLVRVTIAKVKNRDRLADILRKVPIRQGTPGWNCVGWVKEALELLGDDDEALGTNVIEWEKVRNAAMSYCQRKKDDHRFDGKGNFDTENAATYDLMEDKEVIP
ncbi:hypothetical protein J3R83DRAFT_39 [Lanmaoa asiatica]|nr:hypothetical protein J3R83DRAFT_39 [Lanmaoa asiatica]